MSKPSGTNCPKDFLQRDLSHSLICQVIRTCRKSGFRMERVYESRRVRLKRLGGYSDGVPPLPIPNREVKPISADGTAFTRGRVGSRHFKVRLQGLTFFLCVYAVPQEEVSARRCG